MRASASVEAMPVRSSASSPRSVCSRARSTASVWASSDSVSSRARIRAIWLRTRRLALLELVERLLEVVDRDLLRDDAAEPGEAGDRLLHLPDRDADGDRRASLLAGRHRRRDDVATERAREVERVLRRARDGVGVGDLDGERRAHALRAVRPSRRPAAPWVGRGACLPRSTAPALERRLRRLRRSAGATRVVETSGARETERRRRSRSRARPRRARRRASPRRTGSRQLAHGARVRLLGGDLAHAGSQLGGSRRARRPQLVDQVRRRRHGLSSSLRASRAPGSAVSRRRWAISRAGGRSPRRRGRGRSAARRPRARRRSARGAPPRARRRSPRRTSSPSSRRSAASARSSRLRRRASARNQSSAVERAIASSQARGVPRPGSNRRHFLNAVSNVSPVRSSATAQFFVRYRR